MRQRKIGNTVTASELRLGMMYFGTRVQFEILDRFLGTANRYAFWPDNAEGAR